MDLAGPASWYTQDGYDSVNVVRLDVKTVTTPGECTTDDESGCTLADVIADIDSNDDFTVDITMSTAKVGLATFWTDSTSFQESIRRYW